ncbi:unnamed protein product [Calypogeia fissa]
MDLDCEWGNQQASPTQDPSIFGSTAEHYLFGRKCDKLVLADGRSTIILPFLIVTALARCGSSGGETAANSPT